MKTEAPSTYREKYAAEAAGAVIQSAGYDTPGWDAILDEGEELQWQGWSQPKLSLPKGWIFRLIPGLVLIAVGAAGIAGGSGWGLRLTGGIMIALGILALIPWRLVRFPRQCLVAGQAKDDVLADHGRHQLSPDPGRSAFGSLL